jgi:hypothetical protein
LRLLDLLAVPTAPRFVQFGEELVQVEVVAAVALADSMFGVNARRIERDDPLTIRARGELQN